MRKAAERGRRFLCLLLCISTVQLSDSVVSIFLVCFAPFSTPADSYWFIPQSFSLSNFRPLRSYTTVGPSLLSTDLKTGKIARKDGSGVWSCPRCGTKVVNLPFILMIVFACLCFLAHRLWHVAVKKDVSERREHYCCEREERTTDWPTIISSKAWLR